MTHARLVSVWLGAITMVVVTLTTPATAQNDALDRDLTERMEQIERLKQKRMEQMNRLREESRRKLEQTGGGIGGFSNRRERAKKLKQELGELDTDPKVGDEVIALRDIQLKAGSETFGTVAKGEKMVVEQIQGQWLWVRSEQARGWIDKDTVSSARLMEWYERLPESLSVESAGRARAKFRDVLFEIDGAGTQHGTQIGGESTATLYAKIIVVLDGPRDDRWTLHLNFDPSGRLVGPPYARALKGRSYGTVAPGDYVRISAAARQVFVNGQLRRSP